jgi:hypothetical protein
MPLAVLYSFRARSRRLTPVQAIALCGSLGLELTGKRIVWRSLVAIADWSRHQVPLCRRTRGVDRR